MTLAAALYHCVSVEEGDGQRLVFQSDDFGGALKLLDFTDGIAGGRLRIDGKAVAGRPGGRCCVAILRARITGSKVPRPRCVLLSLPSFTGIANAFSGSGLPFSTLSGDFVYRDGVISIENVFGYGELIGFTATGWVDTGRYGLELNGTVAPAYALNALPGISVLGAAFGGAQGLFAADFRLSGATSAPEVSLYLLGILHSGRSAPAFLLDYRLLSAAPGGGR